MELRVRYVRGLLYILPPQRNVEYAKDEFENMINVHYFQDLDFNMLQLKSIQKLKKLIETERAWKERENALLV